MVTLKRILVPTDFSLGSRIAYEYANDFAKKFGGKVDLIHVIPSLKYLEESIGRLGLPFNMDKDLFPHLISEATNRLKIELHDHIDEAQRGEVKCMIERKPSDAIIREAGSGKHKMVVEGREEQRGDGDYDLIIMGARGADKSGGLLTGSITERVVRRSPVPVLAVPDHLPTSPARRILFPTDNSGLSLSGMEPAIALAFAVGGTITVLHIIEIHGSSVDNLGDGVDEEAAIRNVLADNLRQTLVEDQKICMDLEAGNEAGSYTLVYKESGETRRVSMNIVVKRAVSAHYEIVDYAEDNDDLIVMSTHGRSGLGHILLGSTTEKVARYATVPVLTFRPIEIPVGTKPVYD